MHRMSFFESLVKLSFCKDSDMWTVKRVIETWNVSEFAIAIFASESNIESFFNWNIFIET